jgi:peptidyl-prolyl cis-trans isomerase C
MMVPTKVLRGLAGAAVLAVLAGPVAAQGPAAKPAAAPAKPAAVVNGEPILMAELEAVLKNQPPPPTPLTEAQRKELQRMALDVLVDEMLMNQFLRKNARRVEPAEVTKQLAELEAALKKQNKTMQDFLRDSSQTMEQLRADLVKQQLWRNYVQDHVSDAMVQKYYLDNKLFFDKAAVRASHILIRLSAAASEGERQAARAKLQALRQDIVAGKIDFAEAAKKHSECPSRTNGGDIGYFPCKGMVQDSFAKAAFALKVGEVSDVVQTDYGLHLIKVVDRKAGEPSDFAKIKETVREVQAQELLQEILEREHKAARVEFNLP